MRAIRKERTKAREDHEPEKESLYALVWRLSRAVLAIRCVANTKALNDTRVLLSRNAYSVLVLPRRVVYDGPRSAAKDPPMGPGLSPVTVSGSQSKTARPMLSEISPQ